MINKAKVIMWNTLVGTIEIIDNKYVFKYDSKFLNNKIELSPINMPLSPLEYCFDDISFKTFKGLPGLLADSLPDKFGDAIIDAWLESTGRDKDSFNSIDRLCYIGKRGMGSLEYEPLIEGNYLKQSSNIDIDDMVKLANEVLTNRKSINVPKEELKDLIKVGTSAGGARAKAIVAYNGVNFKSGQIDAGKGYEYYILKFDGVTNKDKEKEDTIYQTRIEYAYYLMAKNAKINISDSFLIQNNGLYHFMTKRFDRYIENDKMKKLHMQSLCALLHLPFEITRAFSYEQVVKTMKDLGIDNKEIEELFRRMVFNVIVRNQDDHIKNVSFLMNRKGEWSLSPAYDITFAYDKTGVWTNKHQMLINGKADNITLEDIIKSGNIMGLKTSKINQIIEEVKLATNDFKKIAKECYLPDDIIEYIYNEFIKL